MESLHWLIRELQVASLVLTQTVSSCRKFQSAYFWTFTYPIALVERKWQPFAVLVPETAWMKEPGVFSHAGAAETGQSTGAAEPDRPGLKQLTHSSLCKGPGTATLFSVFVNPEAFQAVSCPPILFSLSCLIWFLPSAVSVRLVSSFRKAAKDHRR